MKIKLSAIHATRIAQLFNSIKVAEGMLADPSDRDSNDSLESFYRSWSTRRQECVDTLYDDYGITVIGHQPTRKPSS